MTTALEHWHRYGWERTTAVAADFVAFVASHDADQLDRPVPDMDWRAIDVVAHVASVFRRYTVNPERAVDAADVARQNAADIDEMDESVGTMLDDITAHVALMEAAIAMVEPAHEFPFHAGQPITLAGGWGNAIGELLAHGDDISRATGEPWTVDGADLEPLWRFSTKVLPGWLTPEGQAVTETWELRFGFASGPVRLRFDHGAVLVDAEVPGGEPDHVIEGEATATTLAVPYQRRPADDPAVARFASYLLPF